MVLLFYVFYRGINDRLFLYQKPGCPVIDSIESYYTDEGYAMFFPPKKVSRDEGITKIKDGELLLYMMVVTISYLSTYLL